MKEVCQVGFFFWGGAHGEGYDSDMKFPMVWGACRWTHLRPHQNRKFGMGLGSNYPWCSYDVICCGLEMFHLWSDDELCMCFQWSLIFWWWCFDKLAKGFLFEHDHAIWFYLQFKILVLVCFSSGAICLSVSLWSFKTSICSLFYAFFNG